MVCFCLFVFSTRRRTGGFFTCSCSIDRILQVRNRLSTFPPHKLDTVGSVRCEGELLGARLYLVCRASSRLLLLNLLSKLRLT